MKDKHYFKILDAVLRLDITKGHLRWKISDVSRAAGVQRTLIYYYFGKSKEKILNAALKIIGDEFFGLSPDRLEMWRQGHIRESILRTRGLIQRAPHIIEFYFHWRHKKSDVQAEILLLEKRYLSKLKASFPSLTPVDARALYAIVFSLAVMPDLDGDVLDRILEKVPFVGGLTVLTKS